MPRDQDELPGDSRLTWSCVEDGFYVGSGEGRLVGYVDRVDREVFQACDASSAAHGYFASLSEAIACIESLHADRDSSAPASPEECAS